MVMAAMTFVCRDLYVSSINPKSYLQPGQPSISKVLQSCDQRFRTIPHPRRGTMKEPDLANIGDHQFIHGSEFRGQIGIRRP